VQAARSYFTGGPQGGPPQQQPTGPVVYAEYKVYKDEGALSIKPIGPTLAPTGVNSRASKVTREGALFLEFAAALPGSGVGTTRYGTRSYGWADKLTWGWSVNEICTVLMDPHKNHKFLHDPNKRGPNEGSVIKELTICPALIGDEGDFMFDIRERVQASGVEKHVSVSVTRAEFFAIRRIGEFAIPYLLGIDLSLTTYLPYSDMGPQDYNQPPMGGQPGPY